MEDTDWLWCLHCERFFQARDLRDDNIANQACAFEDCDGGGIGVDIFPWDGWVAQNPDLKHWPKSVNELKKGMKCSLCPEEV